MLTPFDGMKSPALIGIHSSFPVVLPDLRDLDSVDFHKGPVIVFTLSSHSGMFNFRLRDQQRICLPAYSQTIMAMTGT